MVAINIATPKKCSECPMCKQSGIDVYCGADYVGIDNVFKKRDNCPLTEIVTCKDCKHWHDDGIMTTCDKNIGHGFPKDHFCSDGERRE